MRFTPTALLAVALAGPAIAAPRYALEVLPAPPYPVYNVVEINNAGQVTGSMQLAEYEFRGYLYTPGKPYPRLEPYGTYHGSHGFAPSDLNERGEVAGSYRDRAFVYRSDGTGGYVPNVPGYPPTRFYSINDSGQALGDFTYFQSTFLYTPTRGVRYLQTSLNDRFGAPLDLNNLQQVLHAARDVSGVSTLYLRDTNTGGDTAVAAVAGPDGGVLAARFNDAGLVAATVGAGWATPRAMLYRAGRSYELWRLTGQPWSQVQDLNADGHVLGTAFAATTGRMHAFLYVPGVGVTWPLALIDPATRVGWTDLALSAINDRGQIAGTGQYGGQRRAFVLNPIAP